MKNKNKKSISNKYPNKLTKERYWLKKKLDRDIANRHFPLWESDYIMKWAK